MQKKIINHPEWPSRILCWSFYLPKHCCLCVRSHFLTMWDVCRRQISHSVCQPQGISKIGHDLVGSSATMMVGTALKVYRG